MAVMTVADGTTVFLESIFENRFRHASELAKLGADIDVNMCQATVRGREFLSGADVRSYDLRGAAAMVIGGLMAEGTTRVGGLPHIERGYQDIVSDLDLWVLTFVLYTKLMSRYRRISCKRKETLKRAE